MKMCVCNTMPIVNWFISSFLIMQIGLGNVFCHSNSMALFSAYPIISFFTLTTINMEGRRARTHEEALVLEIT